MDYQIIEFKSITEKTWNNKIENMEGHLQLVTANSIKYYSAFDKIENKSFLMEIDKEPVAAVPLAINKLSKEKFFGFNYKFCPAPVFKKNIKPSMRRKILNTLIEHISQINKNIKKLNFFNHPVLVNKKSEINSKNQFELLKYSDKYSIVNTLIVDLQLSENDLINNLSKYHKRNIFKSKDKLKFNIYNSENIPLLKKKFNKFRNIHYKSAGRFTRPNKTWELMLNDLEKNKAILFSVSILDRDISFLHCGNHLDYAWGWSQANDDEFEKKYMPRHVLEWLTILYFKKKNFKYYELGEHYSNINQKVKKKEISISEFKEKYGSSIYPKVFFKINL